MLHWLLTVTSSPDYDAVPWRLVLHDVNNITTELSCYYGSRFCRVKLLHLHLRNLTYLPFAIILDIKISEVQLQSSNVTVTTNVSVCCRSTLTGLIDFTVSQCNVPPRVLNSHG